MWRLRKSRGDNGELCEIHLKALQCQACKFSVHKREELRGKNIQPMNWFYWLLVFAANSYHHVVNDGLSSNFCTGYFSGCPELFKLSIIPDLLVDESKNYVFKYFPPSFLSCLLLVCKNYIVNLLSAFLVPRKPTELSLVAGRNIKPDISHLLEWKTN